ncbi:lysosomal cystine transporter [Chloropicon primus]|uniref:Lysosomal cystine transporter n=1 Tax=Chloropicon primus TaxID=1764295 RepID=A0A5B8MTV8_9CHLO|nr:lysosomal cystine transporter [Chloropicon primus]UPR03211.1 lysosomal cystine transporter [Chloropicon primus]|mmetsp:Transcript_12173/g.33747  ORF Transcript_12173/g.33747 Transcript_12173/m.33747 type:complete len:317 (+) Transcript_12173:441-1391(+)|eukprot:QDZ23999.1 lysosomal cystine transporter [Chloropicon primus]
MVAKVVTKASASEGKRSLLLLPRWNVALPLALVLASQVLAVCSAAGNKDGGDGHKDGEWKSDAAHFLYQFFGWTAFFSWSCSFYPQIWENWRTYSVEGLSFDFVSFNFIKHSSYGAFNVVLYFSKAVQSQYMLHYKTKTIPVALNDVGFSIHAVLMVMIQIGQLCTHERGNQRITFTATMILAVAVLFILVSLSIALSGKKVFGLTDWLGFITAMNHLQLTMTFIKYSPQAYYNWKRKSTDGWSVWGIILDLMGGICNLFQLLLLCWNNNDVTPLTGDAGKLGLSIETLFFDIIFIFQHYVLYNKRSKTSYRYLEE